MDVYSNENLVNSIFIEISSSVEIEFSSKLEEADITYKLIQRYKDDGEETTLIEIYIPLFVPKKKFWEALKNIFVDCIEGKPRIVENLN